MLISKYASIHLQMDTVQHQLQAERQLLQNQMQQDRQKLQQEVKGLHLDDS